MSTKLRHSVTLVVSEADMHAVLTDAVCDMFGAFSNLRVTRCFQSEDFQFVLEMAPKQQQPQAVQAVPGKEAVK